MWDDPLAARIAGAHRLLRAADPLRQARPGPLGPLRPATDARGEHGRPACGDGRGRLRASGALRDLGGRADVPAVRGHLPRARDRPRPLRHLRADGRGRGLRHRRARRHARTRSGTSWRASGAAPWGSTCSPRACAEDKRFRDYWGRLLRSGSSPRSAGGAHGAVPPDRHALRARQHQRADARHAPLRGPRRPVAWARYLAEAIPGATYVEFEGIDHLPMVNSGRAARRARGVPHGAGGWITSPIGCWRR